MTKYQDTTADILTATSAGGWMLSISAYQPLVSLVAGLIAIVSGVFAVRYYYVQTKKIKDE